MSKKEKKIYKQKSILAQKVSINKKWTIWRKIEQKNRQFFALTEVKKNLLLSLFKDHQKSNNDSKEFNSFKTLLQLKLNNTQIKGSISKQKNYCFYIGRSRSFNRDLYMSRHTFRKLARFGMLPGFIKERC